MPKRPDAAKGRMWWIAALLVLLLLLGLHGMRMSALHGWSDDGSAYLRHALNLLEGRPYTAVSYAALGDLPPPVMYPPGLPVMLVPLIKLWGMNFLVFKIAMLVVFLLSVAVSLAALLRTWPKWIALAAVALLAVDANVGLQNEHINSDFLALLWIGGLVWVLEGFDWRQCSGTALAWRSGVTVALLLLAIETRSVNAVLLGAIPIYSFWRYRKFPLFSWVPVVATTALLWLLRQPGSSSSGGANYLKYFSGITYVTLRRNAIQYALSLSDFIGLAPAGFARLIALAAIGCALYGAYRIIQTSKPFWLLLMALYAMILLLWPFSDPERYIVPFLPMLLACFVYGIVELAALLPERIGLLVKVVVPLLAIVASARAYVMTPPLNGGLNYPATLEMYRAVERLTGPESVIAFRKARSLSLFTDRHSVGYNYVDSTVMRHDFCAGGVTHVVSGPAVFPDDEQFLEPFLAGGAKGGFDLLYRNEQFSVYTVKLECTR
ncbi:MAG: hypothetical protein ABI824_00385 [Acidobacteriota bacterium]